MLAADVKAATNAVQRMVRRAGAAGGGDATATTLAQLRAVVGQLTLEVARLEVDVATVVEDGAAAKERRQAELRALRAALEAAGVGRDA
jgi:hypothetical protein